MSQMVSPLAEINASRALGIVATRNNSKHIARLHNFAIFHVLGLRTQVVVGWEEYCTIVSPIGPMMSNLNVFYCRRKGIGRE